MKTAKEMMIDAGYEDAILFNDPSYDSAFIGATSDGRAVYLYDKMVEHLSSEMSAEEAIEFIDYNVIGSLPYVGEKAPVVVFNLLGE